MSTKVHPVSPSNNLDDLPQELKNFPILSESTNIVKIVMNQTFIDAQAKIQEDPSNGPALTNLKKIVIELRTAYESAIAERVASSDFDSSCRKVVKRGNEDFVLYSTVWNMILKNSTDQQWSAYSTVAQEIIDASTATHKQTTADPSVLFQHAAQVQPLYEKLVNSLVGETQVSHDIKSWDGSVVPSLQYQVPNKLKKMERILEKTLLKRRDSPGNADQICDVVRGMITCSNLSQVSSVLQNLKASDKLVITRVKDRFLGNPLMHWRDCIVNFYLKEDDNNKHICELQLVYNQMMTARKGLPGHAVYNRVRNASELLAAFNKNKPDNRKMLKKWLIEWMEGDETTYGNPSEWDVSLVTDMSFLFGSQFKIKWVETPGTMKEVLVCGDIDLDGDGDFDDDDADKNVLSKFNVDIGKWYVFCMATYF